MGVVYLERTLHIRVLAHVEESRSPQLRKSCLGMITADPPYWRTPNGGHPVVDEAEHFQSVL